MAADPNVSKKNDRVFGAWDLAEEYGVDDASASRTETRWGVARCETGKEAIPSPRHCGSPARQNRFNKASEMRRVILGCSLVVGLLSGCGETRGQPELMLSVEAAWPLEPASPEELGHTIRVTIQERLAGGRCRDWSSSTRVTVNDEDLAVDSAPPACLAAEIVLGPFSMDQSLLVQVEEDGGTLAEADIEGLLPGTAARLASPANGQVRAGDDLVLVPPPSLPSSSPASARFFPIEESPFYPRGNVGRTERQPDGLHIEVPAFVGRAVVSVYSSPIDHSVTGACTGFVSCQATYSNSLGPILVEALP